MLTTLCGWKPPATCELGEVLTAVAMGRGQSSEASPVDADVVQGLSLGPLLKGPFVDLKERRTAALTHWRT
jgi:hypothetical protein